MLLAPGDRVDRYVVIELLGKGGMGEVYRARDPKLARPVALKILHAGRAPGTDGAAKLLREARAAAALSHANVLSIFDVGEVQEPESLRGLPYIAMELVVGRSLRAHIEAGDVPLERRIEWLRDVAEALGAAHQVGIVHRDVKPENVMIRSDGAVKVLDFGIARQGTASNDAWASTLGQGTPGTGPVGSGPSTEAGVIVGTPLFMAPEQLRGEELDGRADQFSWGVMAYLALTGRMPWAWPCEAIALVSQILSYDPPPPRVLSPEIPLAVSDAVVRALSKRREARFGSMEELVAAIEGRGAPSYEGEGPRAGGTTSPAAATLTAGTAIANSQSVVTKSAAYVVPRRRLAIGAFACVAIAGGVLAYRAARAPRLRYCLATEIASDGPRCVLEVGADVVGKRSQPIERVTQRAGRVTVVERINFAGLVDQPWGTDFARMEVVRDDTGAVRELVKYDRYGTNDEWQKWADGGKRIDLVDIDGKTPRHGDDDSVTAKRVEYDAAGNPTKILFFGPTGRPRSVDKTPIEIPGGGVYGVALEYGKTPGVPVKQTNLGADGAPAPNSEGIVFARRVDDGLWGDVSVFDANDRPIAPKGVHTSRTLHDAYEPTGSSFFGLHGEPVTDLSRSFHESRVVWDPAKRTVEWTSFDEQGNPRLLREGWYMDARRTLNARGRPVLIEFLDAQGNQVTSRGGESALRFEYDDHDHETLVETLDPSGALTPGTYACARMERTTNAHGRPTLDRSFDEKGHPAPWRYGGAIARATYDERDLQLSWSSYDADDHPAATDTGYSLLRRKFDRLRNLVELAYFGSDLKPTDSTDGFSTKRLTYDDNGDLVAIAYFDANGAPTPFESSYATERMKNDERGLVVEEAYFDVHGEPVLVKDGYATVRKTRDRNGDVVEEAYLGRDGQPIVRQGGYARKKISFDVTRRPVEIALFDVAGQPVRGSAGWAIERTTYDERGLVIRIDHLDAARAPVQDKDGRASIVKVNDSRGNTTEETSLDPAGKPVATADGYATKKSTYDDRDEVVEEALLGADGNLVSGKAGWSIRRVRYDDSDNILEEAFFGPAHEPVVPKELTYASMRQRFDARHWLVETAYLDVRGVPSKGPDGAAIVRYERDPYGRAVETAYFDGMGVPAPSKDGRVVVRSKLDDNGRLIGERFTDATGSPRAGADGCFGHQTKYDPQGHETEQSCLDASDASTLGSDGWAIRRTLHDARGNAVEVATYGPDGALHADKEGIARRRSRFDDRNHQLETAYFDANDKPAHDKNGAHAVRFTYDDSGKKTGESAFDEHDRPVASKGAGATH